MRTRIRSTLLLLLRLGALGAIAWIVASQVTLEDEIVLANGEVLVGTVAPVEDGFRLTLDDGSEREIPRALVAQRREDVPEVAYGMRTLLRRVGDRPMIGAWVLLGLTFIVVIMAARWFILMRAVDLDIGIREAIRLTFVGGFFNLVVPGSTGGDVVKAYYAARETGRSTRAVLSVFVDRVIGLFTLVLVAAGALFLGEHGEGVEVARAFVLSLLGGGALVLLVLTNRRVRVALGVTALVKRLPFQRVIEEIRAAGRLYKGQPKTVLAAFGISVVNQLGFATVVWALGQALQIEGVTLLSCYALVPVANLVAAVPLVPGGWGVGELAFAYLFGQIGVSATEAVGLSVLFRLSFLIVSLPGGLLWVMKRDHVSRESIEAAVEEAEEHVSELAEPTATTENT